MESTDGAEERPLTQHTSLVDVDLTTKKERPEWAEAIGQIDAYLASRQQIAIKDIPIETFSKKPERKKYPHPVTTVLNKEKEAHGNQLD